MKLEVSPKRMKNLTYLIVILLVLSGFLLGYFFYYIPRNTETIQKNGFLILKTIADNIRDKHNGRLHFYKNIYTNAKEEKEISTLLEDNNIEGVHFEQTRIPKLEDSVHFDIDRGNLVYTFLKKDPNKSPRSRNVDANFRIAGIFSEPVPRFLEPILSVQKKELFAYYALAKTKRKESELLFHDTDFGIRSDFNIDTLLPKNIEAYLTGVHDLNSEYFSHKVYYYPFQLDTLQLVLF
ncbi:MAG: hypothetical protein ACXWCZ_11850, partial [Flavisolibacter sp.]